MAEPKIGLVTVTYNSGPVLEGFFRSLWAQSHSNFICVAVDNQSKDDSLKRLRRETDARLVVIDNVNNVGVAEGNNQGIRYCLEQGCDYVLLINNDVEFEPGLIATLVKTCEDTGHPMVVPKMYFHEPSNLLWCAGGYFVKWAAWYNGHYGEQEIDRGQYDQARVIEYCPTCCMLIRRQVFEAVGLMDPEYFVYYDDVDFCIRALRSKQTLYYTPAAKLWHKVSSSTGGEHSEFSIRYLARNQALLINKNFAGLVRPVFHAINIAYYGWRLAKRLDTVKVMRQRLGIYLKNMRLA